MGTKVSKRTQLNLNEKELRVLDIATYFLKTSSEQGKVATDYLGIKHEDIVKVANKIEKYFDKSIGLNRKKESKAETELLKHDEVISKNLKVWRINFLYDDKVSGLQSWRKMVEAKNLSEAKSKLNNEYENFKFIRAKRLK